MKELPAWSEVDGRLLTTAFAFSHASATADSTYCGFYKRFRLHMFPFVDLWLDFFILVFLWFMFKV